jgi:AhpD family alkylhydroperoxidase
MKRLDKPVAEYPFFVRVLFWKQRRTYGRILDPGRLWGRSPRVFYGVALLFGALDRRSSPLTATLRSLVMVRVSQINLCAFCVDINAATLAERGVATQKVEAIAAWRASPLFDPEEKLALEYAEAVTLNRVDDSLRERVLQHFKVDATIELTGLVAFQNLSSKFNAALGVPAQGFCRSGRAAEPEPVSSHP